MSPARPSLEPGGSPRPAPRPLALLAVEDSEDDYALICLLLREGGFHLLSERVESANELRTALSARAWDIIISDYNLPSFDGLAALAIAQATGRDIPLIIVSGVIGEEAAVQAMRAGARDYVLKHNLARLVPAVRRELTEAEDRARGQEAADQLRIMKAAYDASLNSIVIASALEQDWPVAYVNPAFERETGYSAAEVLGRNCRFLYGSDRSQPGLEIVRKSLLAKHACQVELRNYRKDGSLFYNFISLSPIHDARGRVTHFVSIQTDMTAQRLAEERIRSALQREQELSRLKSGFVSMVSHEFRTPLAIINSANVMLARYGERLTPGGRNERCAEIREGVQRMTALMDDILLQEKIKGGQLTFSPEAFDLGGACRRWCSALERAHALPTPIALETEAIPPVVTLDPGLTQTILTNLISNAIKYSAAGAPVKVRLTQTPLDRTAHVTQAFPKADGAIAFEVTDCGIGIPEEEFGKLFDPFHRCRNVGNIPGTGLGLSIVQQCVQLHGGQVAFRSQLASGTTFRVVLPAHLSNT